MTRAAWIWTATIVIALAAGGVWSAMALADARRAAAEAVDDTAACRQLAGQIAAARQSPATAGASGQSLDERLKAARAAAELDDTADDQVAPQPPRRSADGRPGRRSTRVTLRSVTLHQALTFTAALAAPGPGGFTLETFELRLPTADAPGANATPAGDDEWDVELSVSQPAATP